MTAQTLLKNLQDQQVQLTIVDDKLDIYAPKGVVTMEILVLLAEHKMELLELLSPQGRRDQPGSNEPDTECPCQPDLSGEEIVSAAPPCIASVDPIESIEVAGSDPLDAFADVCCQCEAEVEYYSDQGEAYCELHRYQASQQQCQASPALARVTQAAFFAQDIVAIAEEIKALSGPIALDLETTGLSPQQNRVVSISLGVPGRVFVLDMRPYYGLSPDRQAEWKRFLNQLFDQLPNVTWIGHNIKFDWEFLAVHFGIRLPQVYDTMLMEQVLQAGREGTKGFFSLHATGERYGLKVSKQQRNWFVGLDARAKAWSSPFPLDQLVYMVQDIEVPHRLADLQRPLLVEHDLEMVAQLENQAVPAIASMEVHGVLIDKEGWLRILKNKRSQIAAMEQELVDTLGNALQAGQDQKSVTQIQQYESHQRARAAEVKRLSHEYTTGNMKGKSGWPAFESAGLKAWDAFHPEPCKPQTPSCTINLNSLWQVKDALGYLGIEVGSTQEEVLEAYTQQYPIVEQFLAWRKINHFCRNFGDNMLAHIQADGRIHASFSQVTAVSGRITCREPNLQQIPKQTVQGREEEDVRRCFIAADGYHLLTADLSNIELRILAEISGDPTMLHLFDQGKDMHAETARAMFGLAADIDTRWHLHQGVAVRDIAKTINFGLIYGMGVQGLATRIGVSTEEAQALIRRYFATYEGVDTWLRRASEQAIKSGYASTLAGRKRRFTLASKNNAQRAAIERSVRNHPIQGTNADILKRALSLLYTALPDRIHLLLCVHDEIVLECPEDLLAEGERILKETMVRACRDYLKVVAIPEPEVVVGRSWTKK